MLIEVPNNLVNAGSDIEQPQYDSRKLMEVCLFSLFYVLTVLVILWLQRLVDHLEAGRTELRILEVHMERPIEDFLWCVTLEKIFGSFSHEHRMGFKD